MLNNFELISLRSLNKRFFKLKINGLKSQLIIWILSTEILNRKVQIEKLFSKYSLSMKVNTLEHLFANTELLIKRHCLGCACI